jgi:hypothetical protein
MIRDGLNTNLKRTAGKRPREITTNDYKTDFLSTIANFYEIFEISENIENSRYIYDPYGISLILDPIGVKIDIFPKKPPKYGEITCKEYYNAIINNKIDEIKHKMTQKELLFCDLAAQNQLKPTPPREIVKLISKEIGADVKLALATYDIQPDADAIAFALGSPRAILEGITPVIGLPLKMCFPGYETHKIRFPALVEKNKYDKSQLIHIHKDGVKIYVYNEDGNTFHIPSPLEIKLKKIPSSFVIEGFIDNESFQVWDLLCWNDIWLHQRPLSERVQMLWRFHEWNMERFVVRSNKELLKFQGDYILRNLNSVYNPTQLGSYIFLSETIQAGFLKVGGKRGHRTPHLLTEDSRAVFQIDADIDKDDWGDVVEITQDGTVIKNLGKKAVPDTWSELDNKWGLIDWEDYQYMRLKIVEWPEGEN